MSGIFDPVIFDSVIFDTGDAAQDAEIVLGGKGENDGLRRKKLHLPFKPTGLIDRPSRRNIEQRVSESREIAAEIAGQLAKEFTQDDAASGERVSLSAIDAEIGVLLHKEMQAQDMQAQDMQVIMVLLTACVASGAI